MDNQGDQPDRDSQLYFKLKHERIQEIKRDGVAVSVGYWHYSADPYFIFHPQDRAKIDELLSQEKYVLEVCLQNGHPVMQFSPIDAYVKQNHNHYQPPKLEINAIPENVDFDASKRYYIAKKNSSISVHKNVLSTLKFDQQALTGASKLIKQFFDEKIAVIPCQKELSFDLDMNLNGEQNMAIKKVCKNVLTFIKGPPGCGKTKTISKLCKLMKKHKQKVMLGTVSNTGNLSILKALREEFVFEQGAQVLTHLMKIQYDPYYKTSDYFSHAEQYIGCRIVLFTNLQPYFENQKYDPVTRYFTLNQWIIRKIFEINLDKDLTVGEIQEGLDKLTVYNQANKENGLFKKVYALYRKALREVIQQSDILITTTVLSYRINERVGNAGNQRQYRPNIVILDEASQATWADTLCFLSYNPDRMVLVGDQQQLDPTVISQDKLLKQSVFSRLSHKNPDYFQMLRTQYRMHPEICEFPNNFFYEGLLRNGVKPQDRQSNHYFFESHPISFLNHIMPEEYYQQTDTGKKNYYNNYEIKCIEELLTLFSPEQFKDIGIISPYGLQVKKMIEKFEREMTYGLTIKTCDGYQGGEKDYIFFSCVRSNDQGRIGFCAEPSRINVSLTRARKSLTIIGNVSTLSSETELPAEKNVWCALISFLDAKKKIISVPSVLDEIAYYKTVSFDARHESLTEHIYKIEKENKENAMEYYKQLYFSYKKQEYLSEEVKAWMQQMEQYHGGELREAEQIEKEGVVEKEVVRENKFKEMVKIVEEEKKNIVDEQDQEYENLKNKNKKQVKEIRKILSSLSKVQAPTEEDINKFIDAIVAIFTQKQVSISTTIKKLTKKACEEFLSFLKDQNEPNTTEFLRKVLSKFQSDQFINNHLYQAEITSQIVKIGLFHQMIFLLF